MGICQRTVVPPLSTEVTLQLPPSQGLRPWTYHALLGLLSVTGLRVGEALRLRVRDVD